MAKYPTEILGYSIFDDSNEAKIARKTHICPFTEAKCIKKRGVCSVNYQDQIIAICPNRFLQNEMVLRSIAKIHFGSLDNLLLFPEVASGNRSLGKFDYVIARHRPLSRQIEEFVIVEFQTVDTTNTGKLNNAVDSFHAGDLTDQQTFGFGLNWSNVWKRAFIQLLNKGRVLEKWGTHAFWVVQNPTYSYLLKAYGLHECVDSGLSGSTTFITVDLTQKEAKQEVQLKQTEINSTTIAKLLSAFSSNSVVPSKDKFVKRLESGLKRQLKLQPRFEEI